MSATPFLFFDGDGTLWDFEGVLRHALGIVLAEIRRLRPSPVSDALSVETLTADRNAVAAERRGSRATLAETRRAGLDRTLARCGAPDPDLGAHLYALFMRHRFDDIELFPDVRPALDSLAARYRLGLLTNGNTDPERCGLGGRFEVVLFAEDHGLTKPDRRLYDLAARTVAAPSGPSSRSAVPMVMVGDSLEADVVGAEDAGWRGIWLNRDGKRCPEGTRTYAQIASLADLPGSLVELSAGPAGRL